MAKKIFKFTSKQIFELLSKAIADHGLEYGIDKGDYSMTIKSGEDLTLTLKETKKKKAKA